MGGWGYDYVERGKSSVLSLLVGPPPPGPQLASHHVLKAHRWQRCGPTVKKKGQSISDGEQRGVVTETG
ncbi:hypothetical protein VTH06DRAFT_3910 [Thermothelomyces fergusii]